MVTDSLITKKISQLQYINILGRIACISNMNNLAKEKVDFPASALAIGCHVASKL